MRFKQPKQRTLEGKLLVAAPSMDDPRFEGAVILMLHHGPRGSLGVVLNRPMDPVATNEAAEALRPIMELLAKDRQLYVGGPVTGSLIAIQIAAAQEGDVPSGNSVFLLREQEQLEKVLKQLGNSVRVFVGHAGWTKGQLAGEISRGVWIPMPPHPAILTQQGSAMWDEAIQAFGRGFYQAVLGIKGFPVDATEN